MITQRGLLIVSAAVECLAGLGLILVPNGAVALLLGAELDNVGVIIGRIGGLGLLSLGIACWGARADTGSAAGAGTLRAITFYNLGAGLLLAVLAATGKVGGVATWAAVVLHLGLAVAFATSKRHPDDNSSPRSRTSQ